MKLLGLDHVVLRVRDLERMTGFYVDALGCSIERRLDGLGMVQLRAGHSLIDLIDAAGAIGRTRGPAPGASADSGPNMDHFCLRVEPFDEHEIREHLAEHGVKAGELATRYGADGDGPSLYIDDPEGNTIELKGPPQGG